MRILPSKHCLTLPVVVRGAGTIALANGKSEAWIALAAAGDLEGARRAHALLEPCRGARRT
jgi:hypothetical protein